ncbi:MAG: GDP-mannose 4,6-dehydratase, partial [bacterium]
LVSWNADVHVLVRCYPEQLKHIGGLRDRIHLHRADVRSYRQVRTVVRELKGCEGLIVFHLAAQAHVGESWVNPEETLNTNLLGTLYLLQAIRDESLHLHRFEFAGTSEEYGSFDPTRAYLYPRLEDGSIALNEEAPLNPKSVYATSKVAADFLTLNFYEAYEVPAVIARMFNNFGPHQSPRFITGAVITQALLRDTVEIGWHQIRRDFTYIEDGILGHLLIGRYGNVGETYVFGQGKNISILDWVKLILETGQKSGYWGEKELFINKDRFRLGCTDNADLLADSSKIRAQLGWQPQVAWESGIAAAIKWYAENRCTWESLTDWK